MYYTKFIPNLLTFGNISVGFIALMFIAAEEFRIAASLVVLCMVLDGLDGKLARKLGVSGDFGKELDSLGDVISFGFVPAYFIWNLFAEGSMVILGVLLVVLLLFINCGAYRLARFNLEISSSPNFTGIPITIAGGLLALIGFYGSGFHVLLIAVIVVVLSALMISEMPYPSLKGIHLPDTLVWNLILALVLLIFIFFPFIFLIVLVLYLLSGLFSIKV